MSIDTKARKLTAMQSGEGESVDFSYAVVADGSIAISQFFLQIKKR